MLVWLALVVPGPVDAVTRTYPGPSPCDTTLQHCIDAAAAGDVVEIATNTPIDESPTIDKSLTLRAAAGFTPTLAPLNSILAVSSGSGAFDFVIEGITLQRGPITVSQGSSGILTATIRGNVIQDTFNFRPLIEVFAGTSGGHGPMVLTIEDNELDVPTPLPNEGESHGIFVAPTEGSAVVRGNVIRMQANSQGAAIDIANGSGAFTADVIGNTISGTDYDDGISLFQFAPAGTLTARVINNLITGQNGNRGAPAAIAINVSQGNGSFTVISNTVADNRLGLLVSARLDLGATIDGRIANNILAHSAQADLVIDSDVEATVTNGFNLVFGGPFNKFTAGSGTVFADPVFAGPGDYHLGLVSPAVNAGNDSDLPADITTDLDGNPRIRAGRVDIGALESSFAPAQSPLSVVRVGLGSGTVTSSPGGINCGSTCSASFRSGTAVTLSATAAAGSTFASWGGCDTVLGAQCTVALTSAKTVTATFQLISTSVRLTITKAGTGSGVVTSLTGITCGAICTRVLTKDTVVTLTAAPNMGSTFSGWSACGGTGTCTVTLTADTTVTATFTAPAGQFALAVALRGSASGTVTSNPSGIICPTSCAKLYASGTTVTLAASPGAGASFKGWIGGGCTGTGVCIVAMTAMRSVAAVFSAVFTDPSPTPAVSIIRAVDITELRSAVNMLRARNIGLASVTFTDPTIGVGSTVVKAVHFTELRTAVGAASVQAGVAPPSYTDPTLAPGVTIIRAIDLNELRSALRRLE